MLRATASGSACPRRIRAHTSAHLPGHGVALACRAPRAAAADAAAGAARAAAVQHEQHSSLPPPPPQQQQQQQQQPHRSALRAASALTLLGLAACPGAAHAIIAEPSNALSLPTWAIHVSSVAEWLLAIALFWRYAEVSGNPRWKGMSWGMLPALGSAMAACTWHFFYNSPDLDFLVALQAGLTVIGNFTCWAAAYRIYAAARQEQGA
ncbi:MAG: hypothetical protein J3K34DRAFT_383348 [Monoraphidium minutum]|nr:MAG: hypothetical protein J3K34DRAFT_383348 [Monoraphidium minutum]